MLAVLLSVSLAAGSGDFVFFGEVAEAATSGDVVEGLDGDDQSLAADRRENAGTEDGGDRTEFAEVDSDGKLQLDIEALEKAVEADAGSKRWRCSADAADAPGDYHEGVQRYG